MLRHDSRYVRAVELLDAGQPLAALVLIETQLGEVEERQRSRGRRRWSVTERDLRVLHARGLYDTARLGPAETELRTVLRHRRNDTEAAFALARVLRRQGRFAESARSLEELDSQGHDTWTSDAA